MENKIEKINEALDNIDNLLIETPELKQLLFSFFEKSIELHKFDDLFDDLEDMLGFELAYGLNICFKNSEDTIKQIKEKKLQNENFIKFFINTFKIPIISSLIFENYSPLSLVRVVDSVNFDHINFRFIRADNKDFDLYLTSNLMGSFINYFLQKYEELLKGYVDESDKEIFIESVEVMKKSLDDILNTIEQSASNDNSDNI